MFMDLVRELAGDSKTAGGEERFRCVFCGDNKQRLYVSTEDPYLWNCKHCGRAGNAISFVEEFYSVNYNEAKDILASYDYSVENPGLSTFNELYGDSELTDSEKLMLALSKVNKHEEEDVAEKQDLKPVPYPTNFKYLIDNMNNPEAFPFFNYLNGRGVTLEEIKEHGMGYVVHGEVRKADTDETFNIYNSVIFTTYNDEGQPIYWNSRAIDKKASIKALNAPSRDDEYGKHNTIFNLNNAKKRQYIVIYEGVFNALMSGVNGVATFGKQVTDKQVELLTNLLNDDPNKVFYVALDSDAMKEADSLARRLYEHTKNVYMVSYPKGHLDANDLGRAKMLELVAKASKYEAGGSLGYLLGNL